MDLEARPLRCFVAVAEEQSFSRAAERLRLTQPSVSAQIRELERLIGFELFLRTTRRVELSDRGRQFLDSARNMIDETDRMKRAVAALREPGLGGITIGAAFYTIDIPQRIALFAHFIDAHPDAALRVEMRWQSELLRDLHRGTIDLVLMIGVPIPRREIHDIVVRRRGSEGLYADDLRKVVLHTRRVELLIPEEMALASRNAIEPWMLKGQRVAMLSTGFGEPITGPVLRMLELAGAIPCVPPEATGIGVERYGLQFRIPAVSLGWFDNHLPNDARMVKREVVGFDSKTELVLVGNRDVTRPAVEAFWDVACGQFRETAAA